MYIRNILLCRKGIVEICLITYIVVSDTFQRSVNCKQHVAVKKISLSLLYSYSMGFYS